MSKNSSARGRVWTGTFVVILALTFFCFIVGQGLNAGTSVYLSRIGDGAAFAGILAADFSVAAGIARLLCGNAIDTRGRMLVVRIGGVVMLAGTLGPLVVSGDAALVAWRFLQGAGFAATTTAAATAAADVLPVERLGEGIGYYGLGQALAMSVGPAFALALVSTDPPSNLFVGIGISAALALALALLCRYERHPETLPETCAYRTSWEKGREKNDEPESREGQASARHRGIAAIFERRALPGAIPMMVMCPTFGFGIFFAGLLGTELNVPNPGLFYTVSAVSMILVRLKSSALMDRVPAIKIFTVAVICGVVAYLMFLSIALGAVSGLPGAWMFYLAGVPYGICLGLALPLNQSVAVKNTPPERWGACNALFLLANDIGIGIAAGIWGALNDALGFSASIAGVLICLAASYAAAWGCYPAREKQWKRTGASVNR